MYLAPENIIQSKKNINTILQIQYTNERIALRPFQEMNSNMWFLLYFTRFLSVKRVLSTVIAKTLFDQMTSRKFNSEK